MDKVALSPHVISVWINMDYWITSPPSPCREARTQAERKKMDSWNLHLQNEADTSNHIAYLSLAYLMLA